MRKKEKKTRFFMSSDLVSPLPLLLARRGKLHRDRKDLKREERGRAIVTVAVTTGERERFLAGFF